VKLRQDKAIKGKSKAMAKEKQNKGKENARQCKGRQVKGKAGQAV